MRSTFSFLGLFLDSAATVAGALQSGNIAFRKADQIGNLNDIDLESGLINDTEAEDELSSMILIGPPRRRIECFNARKFSTSEGQLDLTAGTELIALVADLHSASPADSPPGSAGVRERERGDRPAGGEQARVAPVEQVVPERRRLQIEGFGPGGPSRRRAVYAVRERHVATVPVRAQRPAIDGASPRPGCGRPRAPTASLHRVGRRTAGTAGARH